MILTVHDRGHVHALVLVQEVVAAEEVGQERVVVRVQDHARDRMSGRNEESILAALLVAVDRVGESPVGIILKFLIQQLIGQI